MRLWERICKDSQDFGGGFTRIQEKLGENSQGLARLWRVIAMICEDLQDFGRGFARIHEDS